MSALVHCDFEGCDRTRPEGWAGIGWVHIERAVDFANQPNEWDFCSWEHLAIFAGGKVDELRQASR